MNNIPGIIFFGSLLNPLSAATAQYLNEQKLLRLIIIAKSRVAIREGFVCFFSRVCVGLYRYFHVFLRAAGIKRSNNYLSLLEYMSANPDIPKMLYVRDPAVFKSTLDLELKALGIIRCIALTCIFPFKIPSDLPSVEKIFNLHPGKLPVNRGPEPYFWALAKGMEVSAVTIHALTPEFDAGPVLMERVFPISRNISEYRLEKVTLEHLKSVLPLLFDRLDDLWHNALPQEPGVYYPKPSSRDRSLYGRSSIIYREDIFGGSSHCQKRKVN